MNRKCTALIAFFWLVLVTATATGDPAQLREWESWLLEKHTDSRCPWRMSDKRERLCTWPGKLVLTLSGRSLTFAFDVEVYSEEALVALPGDAKHWPRAVMTEGKPARLVENKGLPHVSLARGKHQLTGLFSWARKPQMLRVPESIALVTLVEAGRVKPLNRRGEQLVFSHSEGKREAQERDSLAVEVYRLLKDGVPLTMETRVKLSVSGKPREVSLGRLLPQDSAVIGLESPLPARIEDDGALRVQLVAGEHQIRLHSRFTINIAELRAQRISAPWPEVEYLSFQSDTDTRQAKLSGAPGIDTNQVSIPADWAHLPTYRIDENNALQITTIFRGDHAPLANQLAVKRDLWLDFDGDGLTALDSINGRMHQGWRLNARPDTMIGRATVAGSPVLITDDQGSRGIEIRSPDIDLLAVTRIESPAQLSATGWDARADRYQATLHLPPGWRVLHAGGVDGVYGTWISKWDLWDIFLLLIMVAVSNKLLGTRVAVLAGVTLLLCFHESGAPIPGFPALLLVIALLTIVTGRWKKSVSIFGAVASVLLVIGVVAFAISTFRLAIYPTLERSQVGRYADSYQRDAAGARSEPGRAQPITQALQKSTPAAVLDERLSAVPRRKVDLYEIDESDRVQTGPGLPTWLWNRVSLHASGPVTAEQSLRVLYCPPWLTALWRIVSVLLISAYAGILVLRLARLADFGRAAPGRVAGTTACLVMAVTVAWALQPPVAIADDYPPRHLLDELETRLLKSPQCLPDCASLNNGKLVADETELELRFEVYADAQIALPVPRGRTGWDVTEVNIDGVASTAAAVHDQQTLLLIPRGHHNVRLAGRITGDQVVIAFPLPTHNLSVEAKQWQVDGLVDGRLPNNTLSLHATARGDAGQAREKTLVPAPVAPFVMLHRQFVLGKRWSMVSRIQRLAPASGAMTVSVELLPYEKVLSDSVTISDGKAVLQFADRQQEISWQSSLVPAEQLTLTAAVNTQYLETWQFVPSSLWRISYTGIPPVKDADKASSLQPLWKPWPGETLAVAITRPSGIAGPTQTVEEATLTYQAGKRVQKSTLVLDVRSSLGDDYTIGLPAAAEVLSVALNGKSLNLPETREITIPLQPGLQRVAIEFQEYAALGWWSRTPHIELPGNASNINLRYELPRDRWPLYVSGPAIGPAMMYWGVLCVIVLGAILLSLLASRLNLEIPISMPGWLLLGIGLSTVNSYGVLIAAVFFFALAARRQFIDPARWRRDSFNLLQVAIALWTIITALALITAIPMGLLANPDMKVVGNDSYSHLYNYYQDRVGEGAFPTAGALSVSIMTYRVIMLAWSLWLATRIIQWAQWWWRAYSEKGTWVAKPKAEAAG